MASKYKNKLELPEYINCKSKTTTHCDYLLHSDCPSTCAFALDIGGIGVGGGVRKDITKKLHDQSFLENLRDY